MSSVEVNRFNDLDEAKVFYLEKIDSAAGKIRSRHITAIPGQDSTYEYKKRDAERFIADGSPEEPESYPWVSAEARAMEGTLSEAAQSIVENAKAWQKAGAAIEECRMKGKYKVRASSTAREADATFKKAESDMESISQNLSID